MTNAEKYLKDGIDLQKLCCDYANYCNDRKARIEEEMEIEHLNNGGILSLFFQQNIKPTLTEDERVILRNIQNLKKIHRATNGNLVLCFESGYNYHITWLNNDLFQFIKERRRI